jgi:hypothetical protein
MPNQPACHVLYDAHDAEHKPTGRMEWPNLAGENLGVVTNIVFRALAHLQLGRAHAMESESAMTKSAYQVFCAPGKTQNPTFLFCSEPSQNEAAVKSKTLASSLAPLFTGAVH